VGSPLAALADARRVVLDLARAREPELPGIPGLLAGAAEVDITPPPGMPKAGHSRNAQTGHGFRTRLRSRVLHLRGGRTALTLVQNDLLAGSAILQHLVAARCADLEVPLSGLFVGATHTHAGPGAFHGNALMNRFSANHPGFDPAWTSWLVGRIAGAVRQAVTTRAPARVAVGRTQVWGLTRNRSLDAYVRNAGVDASRAPQAKYAAVNPDLHLVRVDGTDGPLAAMAIFSIHGTGISHGDHAYNADVWAYLVGELGRHIERSTGARAVVGAVEGTHGDVAPAVRPDLLVYPEAERVGSSIGAAAGELFDRLEGDLRDEVVIGAAFREIDLAARPTIGGITLPPPAFGAATVAGAFENTTPVVHLLPPFRPNVPKPFARGPHGAKWIVGGRLLHDRIVPPATFPTVMPLQLLRIGSTVIAGLPFEVTVEAGRRVAADVQRELGPDVERVAVSSLANEQFCYLTTPEEYGLQRYEGGSTLYGPGSQPFVAAAAGRLAADLARSGHVAEPIARRSLAFPARLFLAEPTGRRIAVAGLRAPRYVDVTGLEDGYWEWTWRGPAPGDLCWYEPLARVEAATPDGGWEPARERYAAVDDQGYHLGVVHLGASRGGEHRYAARWFTPYLGPGRAHRFVLPGCAEASSDSFV
jgi:neutral ceramidase